MSKRRQGMYLCISVYLTPLTPTIYKNWQWSFSPFKIYQGNPVTPQRDWLQVGTEDFYFRQQHHQHPLMGFGAHPVSSSRSNGTFPPQESDTNIKLITRLYPAPKLRVRETLPPHASVRLHGMVVGSRDSSQSQNVKHNELTPWSRVLPRI